MTPQEVIKKFMSALTTHSYTNEKTVGKEMLNDAVKASSRFTDAQNVIDSMKADQLAAEREAVEEILGSDYAGMAASQVDSKILKASAKNYDGAKKSNAYLSYRDERTTVLNAINERKAIIFLEKYCGIILPHKFWITSDGTLTYFGGTIGDTGNVDTGAITGSDANITLTKGDVVYGTKLTDANMTEFAKQSGVTKSGETLIIGTGTEKNASSVVPENASAQMPSNTSTIKVNGLTIKLRGVSTDAGGSTSKIVDQTYSQLTTSQQNIVKGIFRWWGDECTKLNEQSYGIGFNSSTAMVKEIDLYFYTSSSSSKTLASVWHSYSGPNTVKLYLNVNMKYYDGVSDSDVDGKGHGTDEGEEDRTTALLDRTLAHEFTHAIMASNIKYFHSLPQFVKEGSAELTHGIDDERGGSIFNLAYDSGKLTKALNLSDTGTGTSEAYSGGYMFMRYLAKQGSLQTLVDFANPDKLEGVWTVNKKNLTYSVNGVVVATLSGLKSGLVPKGGVIEGITVSGKTITLSEDVVGAGTVSLGKNDQYTLALGDGLTDKTVTTSNKAWTFAKGTAILRGDATAGYSLSDNAKSIIYTKAATGKELARITGLPKTGVSASDFSTTSNVITLTKDIIGTSGKVAIKGDGYTLKLGTGLSAPQDLATPVWSIKKNTATYSNERSEGYNISADGKLMTYSKAQVTPIVSVGGLRAGLEVKDGKIDGLTVSGTTVKATNKVLGASNVALGKKDTYTLELDNYSLAKHEDQKVWTVKGAKAYYQNVDTGYFVKKNDKTYTYVKPKVKETLATVVGVKKNVSPDAISLSGNIITLSADAVTTGTVSLGKNDNYTLKLASGLPTVVYNNPEWTFNAKKGVAALTATVKTAGYSTSSDGKVITYIADKDKKSRPVTVTYVTVGGVKSTDGITIGSGNVVSLSEESLNKKKVTLGKNDDYTLLAPVSNSLASLEKEETKQWTLKKTTATLSVTMSTGYTLVNEKTLNYSAKETNKAIAQVGGIIKGSDISGLAKNGKVSLSAGILGSVVSVSGEREFEFATDYKYKAINGSKVNDTITVLGTGNTVAGGKGNDTINLTGTGNTYVYATGDGNDVISNFKSSDKIKLSTKKASYTLTKDSSDVIITVAAGTKNAGTITLKNAASQTISVLDRNGNALSPLSTSSGYWFDEDNIQPTEVNELSELGELSELTVLTDSSADNYSVGSINTTADATSLTQDTTIVATSTKKK